jgi:hypothetical protein
LKRKERRHDTQLNDTRHIGLNATQHNNHILLCYVMLTYKI